jgi:predicted lipoprotein with Yx(FWY)xxD motif
MYGNILESNGKTLYAFSTDTSTTSSCTGKCATAWPPLETTGTPTVTAGVNASLIGHIMRPSGKMQVTYNGHPLYWFIKDLKASAPHTTLGEDLATFGGVWYVVSASTGNPVTSAVSGSTSSTTAGSSY